MNTKTVKNIREPLKKPRPLKTAPSLDQAKDTKDSLSAKARADLLSELEILNVRISNCDFDEVVTADISTMCALLKKYGEELDSAHKEALDRYFCTLRNVCREDRLDVLSRLKLLEIIETRAMHWKLNENICNYFNSRYIQLEEVNERQNMSGSVSPSVITNAQNQSFSNVNSGISLAPGEFLRSSGKFSKPTKIAGKNYYKDEIVIRNCDSGKVNAGARDRLVQITGPHEEAISHAKYLVEDTIKRNVSPVRDNMNAPELTIDSKDHVDYGTSYFDRNVQAPSKRNLTHSYSMSDASSRDFCIPVYVGHDVIMLSGAKSELLKTAKAVLTEYFAGPLEKEPSILSQSKTSLLNNQRFTLTKQASLKDNLPSTISSVEHGYSRQSSSMSSSSDDILPDEESSDLEAISPPVAAPIPPPTYPGRRVYTREFLLECARLPLSHKPPSDYEQISTLFPELISQPSVLFDPAPYLQNQNA